MHVDELTAVSTFTQLKYYICTSITDGTAAYALRAETQDASLTTPVFTRDHDGLAAMARFFADGSVLPCTLNEMCDEWSHKFINPAED